MSRSRRQFLQQTVSGAAALAAGSLAHRATAADAPANKVVLALVGAGGRGRHLIKQLAAVPGVHVKTICDLEAARAAASAKEVAEIQKSAPQTCDDLRKVLDDRDIHGVVIATPEHWHALATIWACQAGKDVFVEKCISRYVWEGRKMVEAARKYKRIVQSGTQCRSAPYAVTARDYIASGGLGTVLYVKVFGMLSTVYGGYPQKTPPNSAPPAGLDWDKWLGPVALRPYNAQVHRNWHGYWDFSGGNASDAIHTLDLARHVLGDPPHPRKVQSIGGRFQFDDGGEHPDVHIVNYQFDKLVISFFNTGFTPYMIKAPNEVRFGEKFPDWPQNCDRIEIYGSKRMMYLARHGGGWQVFEGNNKLVKQDKTEHPDKWHLPNFVDCIRSRKEPNGEILQGHLSACLEHLGSISYRVGNESLVFDGKAERFVNHDAANSLLRPKYRKPYEITDNV